jgi:hypothetical protein
MDLIMRRYLALPNWLQELLLGFLMGLFIAEILYGIFYS